MTRFRVWWWGNLFAHSKPLGRRATRWLYVKLLQARRSELPTQASDSPEKTT